jgi:hypothetical protein
LTFRRWLSLSDSWNFFARPNVCSISSTKWSVNLNTHWFDSLKFEKDNSRWLSSPFPFSFLSHFWGVLRIWSEFIINFIIVEISHYSQIWQSKRFWLLIFEKTILITISRPRFSGGGGRLFLRSALFSGFARNTYPIRHPHLLEILKPRP